ncbi:hypothetical protein [Streptomyces sp. SAJ15]|uniref:hypothetical protein n=1 Tax=Streptomyces sp. SAJ15 TaxID=2011095 RepID=UPI001186560B|nr:hypothetical protein [Streptomyces sp. SAJ15]
MARPGDGREPEELVFCTDEGTAVRMAAWPRGEEPAPGREPLRGRRLTLGTGWDVVQYRLSASARTDHRARDRLEAEIAVGLAVRRAYGDAPYRRLFARLEGYHLDVAEPFVFYRHHGARRGTPLATLCGRLPVRAHQQIARELVLAVRLLAALGVVHRGLTPHAVLWDGHHVRLPEPYAATRTGRPREGLPQTAPWVCPEQRAGRGEAEPRDDVWSVAQVMYHLLTGASGDPDGPPRDLARLPALEVLADAFAPRAVDRPHPEDLLRSLGQRDPLRDRPLPPDPLDAGRQMFDAELARKRAELGIHGAGSGIGTGVEDLSAPPPRGPRRWFGGASRPGREARPGRTGGER